MSNASENQNQNQYENAEIDFDELEKQLSEQLEDAIQDLEFLEEEKSKINDPAGLGTAVGNVVWDQLMNQIAAVAGEDFVKENRGLQLDLRNDAHIQTSENFANGEIAAHNTEIDYQERYDSWQENFKRDENGKVLTHTSKSGIEEATLVENARKPFDENRPHGSAERHTDMDHTVSAGEIIRNPAANAHMTREEQVAFANSDANLNELDSSLNRSKGDKTMDDWLDCPNARGQKPDEIFDNLDEAEKSRLRKKDKEARAEFDKQIDEGRNKSVMAGKKSQKAEALRIGGKAARAVLMNLLMEFLREVIGKLINWLRLKQKNFNNLLENMKAAVLSFIHKLKTHLLNAGDVLITVILEAIWGPIVRTIKKFWIMLKQGCRSLRDAVLFLRDPANKNMPFEIKVLQVGKIVVAGLTAGGAIALSEVIEAGLLTIPGFAVEIPLLGSLANILGVFLGSVVAGIIGAIVIHLIDKRISEKQKADTQECTIDKHNNILNVQHKIISVQRVKLQKTIEDTEQSIIKRHSVAAKDIREALEIIEGNCTTKNAHSEDFARMDELMKELEE